MRDKTWIHVFTGYGPVEETQGFLDGIHEVYRRNDNEAVVSVTTGETIGTHPSNTNAPLKERDRLMGLKTFNEWLQHEHSEYNRLYDQQHGPQPHKLRTRPRMIWVAHSLGCLAALRLFKQVPVDRRPDRVILVAPIWTLRFMKGTSSQIQFLAAIFAYLLAICLLFIARLMPSFRLPSVLFFGTRPTGSILVPRAQWIPVVLWATITLEVLQYVYLKPFAKHWLSKMPVQVVLFERDELGTIPEHLKTCMRKVPIQLAQLDHMHPRTATGFRARCPIPPCGPGWRKCQ